MPNPHPPSSNGTRQAAPDADASKADLAYKKNYNTGGEIKTQINLPWPKAIQIALNSLKIRFWRSMITGAGIFLGIAFLCYSGTPVLMMFASGQGASSPDINRQIWLVVMALLVCTVGITNSMLMSVAERFREIGTMKCLGALDSLIVRLFIIEAVFMGVCASGAGWLLGFTSFVITHGVHGLSPALMLEIFGLSVGIGAFLTLFAALLPALRASQMPPAAALRSDV